jgi:hypothetical protein
MEREVSLLSSQEPFTGPYREPDESSPHPHNLFKIRFLLYPPIYICLPSGLPFGFLSTVPGPNCALCLRH